MVVRRGVAAMALLGLVVASAPAFAQVATTDGALSVSAGYTISQSKQNGDPPKPPIHGPYAGAGASVSVGYETPQTTQKLTLGLSVTLPITIELNFAERPVSYSNQLTYSLGIPLNPRTSLAFGLAAGAAPVISTSLSADASKTVIDAVPSDFGYNFSLSANELLTYELDEDTTLSQATVGNFGLPFNIGRVAANTLSVSNSLSAAREWTNDSGNVTASTTYTHFTFGETATDVTPARGFIVNSAHVGWSRPWTPNLGSSVSAGVAQAFSADAADVQTFSPAASAALAYAFTEAAAGISYTYGAQVSTGTATFGFGHLVALRFAMPIGDTGFATSATAGYGHTRAIDENGELGAALNVWVADASVRYVPPSLPMLGFNARVAGAVQQMTDDPLNGGIRYNASINMSFAYPNIETADAGQTFFPSVYTPHPVLGKGVTEESTEAEPASSSSAPGAPPAPAQKKP